MRQDTIAAECVLQIHDIANNVGNLIITKLFMCCCFFEQFDYINCV